MKIRARTLPFLLLAAGLALSAAPARADGLVGTIGNIATCSTAWVPIAGPILCGAGTVLFGDGPIHPVYRATPIGPVPAYYADPAPYYIPPPVSYVPSYAPPPAAYAPPPVSYAPAPTYYADPPPAYAAPPVVLQAPGQIQMRPERRRCRTVQTWNGYGYVLGTVCP